MLKTFKLGGLHPPDNKLSAGKSIETLPVPELISIPLSQHLGVPATPVVARNDKVKVGQLIGKSNGFISSNIHSSVSGTVFKIDKVIDSSGFRRDSVIIKVEDDIWLDTIDKSTDLRRNISISSTEIIKRIQEAGIVGLGGATFPTHIKLMVPKGKKAEYLIINGSECEPYLTSDHQLMLEKGKEIVVGAKLMMKALNVNKCIFGIENNKIDAIRYIKDITSEDDNFKVVALKDQYPQGGEKQLINATINREVPFGKLPIEVGAVVQNVGTVYATYEAVQKNKPLFERVVTVTGKQIKNPLNILCRIGIPISLLIEKAGGLPEKTGKIINGGPMMGKSVINTDIPVTKGTSGILLFEQSQSKRKEVFPCIRCSKCNNVCPMGLEPFLLMNLSQNKLYERMEKELVLNCIECGSCSYSCPSNRPLLDYIRLGKQEVGKMIRARKN